MISRSLVCRQLVRFCTNQPVQKNQSQTLIEDEKKKALQIPIHLRPYEKTKYEVPMKKIKKNSGYAVVQIQPFPRARIMKICYNILTQVKKGIPENYLFRVLTQQKTKFIMEIVDKEEDPARLQDIFGRIPIEVFIRNLADQFEVINVVRTLKPWEKSQQQKLRAEQQFITNAALHPNPRHPQYRKGERTKASLL